MNRRAVVGGLIGLPFGIQDVSGFQATPEATPVSADAYPVLHDARELFTRPWTLEGQLFSISGTILQMDIAPPGLAFNLEEQTGMDLWFRCVLTLAVELPGTQSDNLIVGFDDDPKGAFEGDRVIIKGELIGQYEAINQRGLDTLWPFVRADQVIVHN